MPTQAHAMPALDAKLARRLLVALAASIALHALVLSLVRAVPPKAGQPHASTIVARIELRADTSASEPIAPSPVQDASPAAAEVEPHRVVPVETAVQEVPPRRSETAPQVQAARPQVEESRPALEIAPLRDPTYYPIGQLDRLPALLGVADACYPDGAIGEVAYLLLIDDSGVVNEATIVDLKPEGLFVAAALESCRALKFTPARKDGRAVRSRVRFVVGPKPAG